MSVLWIAATLLTGTTATFRLCDQPQAALDWFVAAGEMPMTVTICPVRSEAGALAGVAVTNKGQLEFREPDVGYFRGGYATGEEFVSLWDHGSSTSVLLLGYRHGKVEKLLYTWSKWLPEILYAHQGRDLVVIIPNESSPDEYSHGSVASPREASIYVPFEGTYKRVARVPWQRRFENVLAAK